jgi:uncharacterized protein (TIGR03435 family)
MLRTLAIAVCFIALKAQVAVSQTFEVAAIKANKSGSGSSSDHYRNGMLIARNVTLHHCMELAYGVKDYQISGPSWLGSERYDISAKAQASTSANDYRPMLQALLVDRFKLLVHRETKQLLVYSLIVPKNGSKLHVVEGGTENSRSGRGYISAKTMTTGRLADILSRVLERPVLDSTGLKGTYDIELKWTPDEGQRREGDPDGPSSIFTAVQEQLGLKLEGHRGPVEIIVVDHAERVPTEN